MEDDIMVGITVQKLIVRKPHLFSADPVRAGHGGLTNHITNVNVMEVPDVNQWLRKGDLLLTTGYSIKDDPEAQERLIPTLARKGVSALAFKTRRYFDEIPEPMIRLSNEYDFPILELSQTFSYSQTISEVLLEILSENSLNRYRKEHFLKSWIFGEWKDPGTISMQAALTDIRLSSRYAVAVTHLSDAPKQLNASGSLVKYLDNNRIHYFETATHLVLLLPESYCIQAGPSFDELWEMLHRDYHIGDMQVGISSIAETEHMPKAYGDALEALELGGVAAPGQRVVRHEQMGVYPLLRLLSDHEKISERLLSILEPLVEYDRKHQSHLLHTLETYLRCGANAKETAKTMFCHYNSINNRLERIQQVLGMPLKDPEAQFQLHLALKVNRLLEYRRKTSH